MSPISVARAARRGSGRGAKRILRGGEFEGEPSLLFEEEFESVLGREVGRSSGDRLGVLRGVTSLPLSKMPCLGLVIGWKIEEVVVVATMDAIGLVWEIEQEIEQEMKQKMNHVVPLVVNVAVVVGNARQGVGTVGCLAGWLADGLKRAEGRSVQTARSGGCVERQ